MTTTSPAAPPAPVPVREVARPRVAGLDGLRGLAALYVVLFHCWLYTFRGFPANHGPWWLGWLVYGRLAVVFFLVVSGFSLALSAASHGWELGGVRRFLRRRAWRILPPYWAALAFSLLVAWTLSPARGPDPTPRTVVVYGALLQDVVAERTPNAAFWSIAVEAELYLLFPLLLLLRRRLGAVALLVAVTVPLLFLTPSSEAAKGLMPHLAPAFAAGMVGAGIVVSRSRVRRLPWPWLCLLTFVPVAALIAVRGSVWTVEHYVWIDLLTIPSMTLLLVSVAVGRPHLLVKFLSSRPLEALGRMSYSLYLIHVPLVMVAARHVAPMFTARFTTAAFLITLAVSLPATLLAARIFARLFEWPFQNHRSWHDLRSRS